MSKHGSNGEKKSPRLDRAINDQKGKYYNENGRFIHESHAKTIREMLDATEQWFEAFQQEIGASKFDRLKPGGITPPHETEYGVIIIDNARYPVGKFIHATQIAIAMGRTPLSEPQKQWLINLGLPSDMFQAPEVPLSPIQLLSSSGVNGVRIRSKIAPHHQELTVNTEELWMKALEIWCDKYPDREIKTKSSIMVDKITYDLGKRDKEIRNRNDVPNLTTEFISKWRETIQSHLEKINGPARTMTSHPESGSGIDR